MMLLRSLLLFALALSSPQNVHAKKEEEVVVKDTTLVETALAKVSEAEIAVGHSETTANALHTIATGITELLTTVDSMIGNCIQLVYANENYSRKIAAEARSLLNSVNKMTKSVVEGADSIIDLLKEATKALNKASSDLAGQKKIETDEDILAEIDAAINAASVASTDVATADEETENLLTSLNALLVLIGLALNNILNAIRTTADLSLEVTLNAAKWSTEDAVLGSYETESQAETTLVAIQAAAGAVSSAYFSIYDLLYYKY